MGTDWFVKVKCPRPDKMISNHKEHVEVCSGCPYAIWEEPEPVAGFMSSMCGVRVGSIGMASDLDTIAEKLLGIERFTKIESNASFKLRILKQIRSHAENKRWHIESFTREETLKHVDILIEFCKRAEAKGLKIRAWA
jgi:hypothetical protein